MEAKIKSIKDKQKKNVGNVTKFVFDNPNFAILISLMQLISAFIAELLCLVTVGGQRIIWKCFNLYVSLRIIATIDNIYLNAIQDETMDKMTKGAWQPLVIYKKLKWSNRDCTNKLWFILFTLVQVMYKCFYFYFFPFLTMMLNVSSPPCSDILLIDEMQSYNQGKPVYSGVCDLGNYLVVDLVFGNENIWTGPNRLI